MKTKILIVLFLILSVQSIHFAQSSVKCLPGSIIEISKGAEICSDDFIVEGTLYVNGTIYINGTIYKAMQPEITNKEVIAAPDNFSMGQNYPNPSNPKSRIDYELPVEGKVNITVCDVTGKEVSVIINEIKPAGYYSAEFDGTDLSSGVYFYRIDIEGGTEKFTKTLKMILVK